ncbi:hypothetical protein [Sandaracinus amylolyticus]|uniref:hypothetical protein n=1 Tax=Sandaracinus amylolyticus TaxID=927083 RepID=UPI001F2161BD|nr:hypothetical protein [Sandaracinus amylolyticus]UJR78305.1 Hypothetical protein I5071_3320 [Sandaracinus amylolyticus]
MRALFVAFAVVIVAAPARAQAPIVSADHVRIGAIEVPGYPPPRPDGSVGTGARHRRARLTHAVLDRSGTLVAIAGACFGTSGVTVPVTPSCAPSFVRIHRVADGALVRELAIPWPVVADETSVLAMSFDPDARRIAVLTRVRWSDCSALGTELHLAVLRIDDGALLSERTLWRRGAGGDHAITLRGDELEWTTRWGARSRARTISLRAR